MGLAATPEYEELLGRGYPHLRRLIEDHPDDGDASTWAVKALSEGDPKHYFVDWPAGVARGYLRGYATSRIEKVICSMALVVSSTLAAMDWMFAATSSFVAAICRIELEASSALGASTSTFSAIPLSDAMISSIAKNWTGALPAIRLTRFGASLCRRAALAQADRYRQADGTRTHRQLSNGAG
jgi:hypothetical protein